MFLKPDKKLIHAQMRDNVMQYAGQTAMWRQWISASAGNKAVGYGDVQYYRSQTITALFAQGLVAANMQNQYPGGQYPAGTLRMTTKFQVGYKDEIVYNGQRYRID